ncbi:hypothetical protein SDRG_01812 [Saprolegnia diclina VS20]|uniref:Uncharacterized protein n=1 Tax=Saprolegnia diclina (strain VS20) TaxID=1156394 RepID=T0R319_SAPDV|nr:hypothetical protein SDRG_01812 [Saprolegnia diclina VS20]EQC40740.1 hypothetical protein SDRG_01812 [Saprolegnia diclina VS20]|eukprot:XP_008605584.1 hypothetical protein SDRG_01812 [Saprolegnia diclina VS20]
MHPRAGILSQTERALHEANLILFLVDGREGITEIDKHFARYFVLLHATPNMLKQHTQHSRVPHTGHGYNISRALVLVANKSDLVENAAAEIERIRKELDGSLAQKVRGVPVVHISALTGVRGLLPEVIEAHNRCDLRVTTGRLNRAPAMVRGPAPDDLTMSLHFC